MLRDKFNRTDIVLAVSVMILALFLITVLIIPPTTFYTEEFDDFSVTVPSYTYSEEIPDGAVISDIFDVAEIWVREYSVEEFDDFNSDPYFLEEVYDFNDTHCLIDIDANEFISDDYGLYFYYYVIVPKKDFDKDTMKLKADTKLIMIRSLNYQYMDFIIDNAEFGG